MSGRKANAANATITAKSDTVRVTVERKAPDRLRKDIDHSGSNALISGQ